MKQLLKVRVGSHAFGTNIETSDEDFLEVHQCSNEETLGFNYKDELHLQKLAIHLKTGIKYTKNKTTNFCKLYTGNKEFARKWLSILEIDKPKTYYPPNLSIFLTKEYLLPFFIGIIDGDGCIEVRNNKMAQLKVECHGSWFNNLLFISEFLQNNYKIPSRTIITNRGYTLWKITSHKNGIILRNLIKELNIPYLKRKWDVFNDDINGTNFYKNIELEIIRLYKEGYNLYKISKMLNVNYHSLYNHKKELLTKI